MAKEFGEIKITETEDGFQVNIKGKNFKEMFSRCCMPVLVSCGDQAADCCPPATECCPPDKDKK
ncbi:hypothetical protein ACFLQW_00675 [Candidatus Zixiibacteriota bacterium]